MNGNPPLSNCIKGAGKVIWISASPVLAQVVLDKQTFSGLSNPSRAELSAGRELAASVLFTHIDTRQCLLTS